jgi:alkyl sulfatase BDS1-like metallo-beta-lactamase superfamily hydrolase
MNWRSLIPKAVAAATIAIALGQVAVAASGGSYDVERTFPEYYLEQKKYFEPKTYQIADYPVWSINNVEEYLSNSMFVIGDEGVVVIDTGIGINHGKLILDEIRKETDKPIVAVIYSHHHPDHIGGAAGLVSPDDVQSGKVKLIAYKTFTEEYASENQATGPIQAVRTAYYAGVALLPEDDYHHGCCGKRIDFESGYIAPNTFVDDGDEMTIAGVKLKFYFTGGETLSQMSTYLPDYKVAHVGDEIYQAMPNIYTIRGAKYREPDGYVRAMEIVLNIGAEHLVGGHLVPISGKEKIRDVVVSYRDAVQYMKDQTVRYINKGYTIDELKEKFQKLPTHLDIEPYTKEMYGSFEHNSASIYTGLVGYFNGDPIEYKPTPRVESAKRHVSLMGGREKLLAAAQAAYHEGDYQWAAELATYLIRVDLEDMASRKLKAAAFRQLGYAEKNTTWRSWFLTSALELEGVLDPSKIQQKMLQIFMGKISIMETKTLLETLRYKVDAEKAGTAHIVLAFVFTDKDEQFTVEMRNSVLIVREGLPEAFDAKIELKRAVLDGILTGKTKLRDALESQSTVVNGKAEKVLELFGYLDSGLGQLSIVLR